MAYFPLVVCEPHSCTVLYTLYFSQAVN